MKGEEAEAIFNWNGDNVVGSVHVKEDSWVLQGCGDECFLWVKQTNNWQEETLFPTSKTRSSLPLQPDNDWTNLMVNNH